MPRQQKLQVKLYTPHDGQLLLHNNNHRFRVMSCGRRFGKTLAATNELAKKALEKNSSLNWWIAPTYRQTEIAFELLAEALRPVASRPPNRSKMRIDLINHSVVECRSAERYENMRGDGPSFAVFDEASKCPKAAWQEVVRPALMDNQGGAIFISTPWGRDWFWELFQQGQSEDPIYRDWWSHSFPTWANPFIPKDEIEEAKRTLPERVFAQEFEAIFLDDAATVFRNVNGCAIGSFEPVLFGHHYIIGWDVAKHTDYSVFTVIDADTHKVVAWKRFHRVEYNLQIDSVLLPLVREYNNAHVVMDSTGVGDPILEEVRKRDISCEGFYFTNASKKELIDRLVVAIEQTQVIYPPIKELMDELKAYTYQITKSRNIVYGAPDGIHDDCVTSLALAVYGAKIGAEIPFLVGSNPANKDQGMKIQAYDNQFLMERQRLMAQSLSLLGTRANYQSPQTKDDTWGIA